MIRRIGRATVGLGVLLTLVGGCDRGDPQYPGTKAAQETPETGDNMKNALRSSTAGAAQHVSAIETTTSRTAEGRRGFPTTSDPPTSRTQANVRETSTPAICGVVVGAENDAPVPGATVTLYFPAGDVQATSSTQLTADDGQFRFESVTTGSAIVTASADGFTPVAEKVRMNPGGADCAGSSVTLRLGSGGAVVTGTVFIKETGDAAAGAVVTLAPGSGAWTAEGRLPIQTATADTVGAYRFAGVLPSTYKITAQRGELRLLPPDRTRQYHPLAITDRETTSLPDLFLYAGHTITGVVRDLETSKPLEGVELWTGSWGAPGGTRKVTTDPSGEFKITGVFASEASTNLYIRKPGYKVPIYSYYPRPYLPVTLDPAKLSTTRDIDLVRALTVSGTVKNEEGKPVAGARVVGADDARLFKENAPYVMTGEKGDFQVDATPFSSIGLRVRAPGYAPAVSTTVAVKSASVEGVEITLKRAAAVRGQVLQPDQRPAAGASVRVRESVSVGGGTWWEEAADSTADEHGRFQFEGLPLHATITARAPGYAASEPLELKLNPAEEKSVVLKLSASHFLAGRVVTKAGRPVADAQLQSFAGDDWLKTTSGPDGSFELEGLPKGPVTVHVTHANFSEQYFRDEKTDRRDAELVLGGGLVDFVGTVVDNQTWSPVAEFTVSGKSDVEKLGEPGKFRIRGLTAEKYVGLQIRAPGYAMHRAEFHVPAVGDRYERTFRLVRPGKVKGRIVEGNPGKPVGQVRVSLWNGVFDGYVRMGANPDSQTETDAEGRFALEGATAGVNTLLVEPRPPHVSVTRRLVVPERGEEDAGDITIGSGAAIRGRVVRTPGDSPVAGTEVKLASLVTDKEITIRSGDDGQFEFANLEEGNYNVSAGEAGVVHTSLEAGEVTNVTVRIGAAVLRGTLLKNGSPAAGHYVQVVRGAETGAGSYHFTKTGDDGRFEVSGLAGGRWTLYVSQTKQVGSGSYNERIFQTEVELTDGEPVDRVFTLPGGRVTGQVLSAGGDPVGEATVMVQREEYGLVDGTLPQYRISETKTDAGGRFVLEPPFPAGPFTVVARKEERGSAHASGITVPADGDATPIVLRLSGAGGTLESLALDMTSGAPLMNATLVLTSDAGLYPHTSVRDNDGVLTIAGIPPGTYTTRVTADSYSTSERTVTIEEGVITEIEDVLYPAGSLQWTLRDPAGRPRPGLRVELTPVDPSIPEAPRRGTTDTHGRWFTFGLMPGNYTATATNAGGVVATISVTIEPGRKKEAVSVVE